MCAAVTAESYFKVFPETKKEELKTDLKYWQISHLKLIYVCKKILCVVLCTMHACINTNGRRHWFDQTNNTTIFIVSGCCSVCSGLLSASLTYLLSIYTIILLVFVRLLVSFVGFGGKHRGNSTLRRVQM